MGGQCHALAALPLGNKLSSYFIGVWLGPRAGLDEGRKSCPHGDSILRPSSLRRVPILTKLSWPCLLEVTVYMTETLKFLLTSYWTVASLEGLCAQIHVCLFSLIYIIVISILCTWFFMLVHTHAENPFNFIASVCVTSPVIINCRKLLQLASRFRVRQYNKYRNFVKYCKEKKHACIIWVSSIIYHFSNTRFSFCVMIIEISLFLTVLCYIWHDCCFEHTQLSFVNHIQVQFPKCSFGRSSRHCLVPTTVALFMMFIICVTWVVIGEECHWASENILMKFMILGKWW